MKIFAFLLAFVSIGSLAQSASSDDRINCNLNDRDISCVKVCLADKDPDACSVMARLDEDRLREIKEEIAFGLASLAEYEENQKKQKILAREALKNQIEKERQRKNEATAVIKSYSMAQNRSRRAELSEKMSKTSCSFVGRFQICPNNGMRDYDVFMAEWTELCEFDSECRDDLRARKMSQNSSTRETRIIGDKYTDGGKRREVWGWCSNGQSFNGAKWNNDNYWTIFGNGKGIIQPFNVSLDGAIGMICN